MPLDRSTILALAGAALAVVIAIPLGLAAARVLTPPARTPLPVVASTPVVFPTVPPPDPAAVFRQPLAAGCATSSAVWVVSDGGGIGRFDGESWALVDATLRSLVAARCTGDTMLAVGGAGRILFADDMQRTIRPETTQLEDLHDVSLITDGAIVVGARGVVLRQARADWIPHASGIEEDLYGVAAFSPTSAWVVGAGGATYRLEAAGWRPIASGVGATLRAVAATKVDDPIAVGDGGTVLVWDGAWRRLDVRTTADLRGIARDASGAWIVGDGGTFLRYTGGEVDRVDLRTTCHLRAVFLRDREVWIVGSDATRAGVWRVHGEQATQWGSC